jgi:Cu(I)-responsive transcriptional regulator
MAISMLFYYFGRPMKMSLNIGEAAKVAGVSTKMIRHYEQIGLMPEANRTTSGYRQYNDLDLSVLRFIRQSRRLGFSMAHIADLIKMWGSADRTSRDVKALAEKHLADIEQKLQELLAMKAGLQALVSSCHGDDDPHCAIIDKLAAESKQAPDVVKTGIGKLKPKTNRSVTQTKLVPLPSDVVDLMAWTRRIGG